MGRAPSSIFTLASSQLAPSLVPGPDPVPVLSLARVHRLLRPLRASLAAWAAELHHVRALVASASASAVDRGHRRPPRLSAPVLDPDWATLQASARKRIARSSRQAASTDPDSSPFKQVARRRAARAATTYGSRRAALAGSASTQRSASRSPEASDELRPSTLTALTPSELAARLAAPETGLSTPALQQRALAALRAYAHVLEAVARPVQLGPPSLAQIAARALGWGIEADLRTIAAMNADTSSDDDSASDVGTPGPRSGAMRRSASAQEAEQYLASAQDEWYESCPPHAVRYMLGNHATAIVIDALEVTNVAFPVWECCFDLCLAHGAYDEASRFHTPLIAALCSSPRAPSPPLLHSLLLRDPSPSSFLHSTLVPFLLSSSFSQRLFFHPSLSIPDAGSPARIPPRAGDMAAGLFAAQCTVACAMLRSLGALTTEASQQYHEREPGHNDFGIVDGNSVRRMHDEVHRRVVVQARSALGWALRAAGPGTTIDDSIERGQAVRDLGAALQEILRASAEVDPNAHACEGDDRAAGEDDPSDPHFPLRATMDDLRALEAVCGLADGLLGSMDLLETCPLTTSRSSARVNPGRVEYALRKFFPMLLELESAASSWTSTEARLLGWARGAYTGEGRDLAVGLLRALGACNAASRAVRLEADQLLLQECGKSQEGGAATDSETDYDEPDFRVGIPPRGCDRTMRLSQVESPPRSSGSAGDPCRANQADKVSERVSSPESRSDVERLVLSPSPSTTPPPPCPYQQKPSKRARTSVPDLPADTQCSTAISEADDLDLLQSVKRHVRPRRASDRDDSSDESTAGQGSTPRPPTIHGKRVERPTRRPRLAGCRPSRPLTAGEDEDESDDELAI